MNNTCQKLIFRNWKDRNEKYRWSERMIEVY